MAEICEICCQLKTSLPPGNDLYYPPCGHSYCHMCLSNYVISHMSETGNTVVVCPTAHCPVNFAEHEINEFMYQPYLVRYTNLKQSILVSKDTNKKICPNLNCGLVVTRNGTEKCLKCQCGFTFCYECGGPYSEKHSCTLYTNNLRVNLGNLMKKQIMKCPNCKVAIVKEKGCNHMTCPYCKYQWCYLCGAKYTPKHYVGLFGCADHFKELSFEYFLLFNYVAFLLFPVVFLIVYIICLYKGSTYVYDKYLPASCGKRTIVVACISMISILLFVLGYPLLFLPGLIVQLIRLVLFTSRYINKRKIYIYLLYRYLWDADIRCYLALLCGFFLPLPFLSPAFFSAFFLLMRFTSSIKKALTILSRTAFPDLVPPYGLFTVLFVFANLCIAPAFNFGMPLSFSLVSPHVTPFTLLLTNW